MEEVRNSENLKKEILEDARKKAERIVKNAEKQANGIRDEWDRKTAADLAEIEREYSMRASYLEKETMAALPLEKRRIRQNFFTEKFEECLADFAKRMGETEAEAVFKRKLAAGALLLGEGKLPVYYSGLSLAAAKRLVRDGIDEARILAWKEIPGPKGIVLRAEKGEFTYRITLGEITEELREYHRKEIFEALFKENAEHD